MNNLSTNTLILGSGILTTTGNNLYLNGSLISGGNGGTIYPLPSINYNTIINWSSGNTFYNVLTGNTTFTFSNQKDGQTIVVLISNTGGNNYSGIWPIIKWPFGITPIQTSGNYTDIYTLIDVTGIIYGNAVQGF